MKKFIALLLSFVMITCLFAGCGEKPAQGGESDLTLALVVAGNFGDRSFYDSSNAGATRLEEETDVIHIGEFEGGKYAVFQLDHTAEAIQKAWQNIFTELKSKGHMVDNTRGMVERYTAKMDAEHKCEICIPVK